MRLGIASPGSAGARSTASAVRSTIALLVLATAGVAHAQTDSGTETDGIAPIWPKPRPAAETVELRAEGAVGLDAGGKVVWTIRHASLAETATKPPPPVVRVGDHAVYAIRGDLIEADVHDGVVVRRTRFPAEIDDVQAAKDAGVVDVRLRDAQRGGASVDVVRFELGKPAPGRASTDAVPWVASAHDAGLLVPRWDPKKNVAASKLDGEERATALAAVREAAERDPTNPHYRLIEGQLLDGADRGRAYVAAATTAGAPWTDLLHVWSELEELGAPDAAAQAFDRAIEGRDLAGVRPDRHRGLIWLTTYVPRDALGSAIEAKDVARVDALSTRLWRLSPNVEGGRLAWTSLAAWFDARDRKDLGDEWRARARATTAMTGIGPEDEDLDMLAAIAAALLTAIPLVALLIGLRRGAESRTVPMQFPYLQLVDLAAMLLPLIPAVYAQVRVTDAIVVIGRSASAPSGLFADAVDSETVAFVDKKLPESEAKTRVLTYLRAELEALRAGGRSDAEPYDHATLVEAFRAPDPMGTRLRRVDEGYEELQSNQRVPAPSIPRALGLALLLFAIGFAVARRKPGAQLLARIVPGGAGPLWAFAGLVTGAFLCGLYHFAWDPWLGEIAVPRFDELFGLGGIPEAPAPARATPWWPFAVIGGAVAAQAAAALLELRRRP